jgi:hypothetical protein
MSKNGPKKGLHPLGVNIRVSSHCYSCLMPCGIRVEIIHGVDFLQVVNTISYATTMDFSNVFSLENHNSHIHTCFFFSFLQSYLFLIANERGILNMTFTKVTLAILLIWFILGSSNL